MSSRVPFWKTLASPRGRLIAVKRLQRNDQLILLLLAVVVGGLGGLAAIAFRYAIDGFQHLALGFPGEQVASGVRELAWWHVLLAPSLGGLLIGLFIHRSLPSRKPEAVAHVIEAAALKGARMPLGAGLKTALASAASIGCGASVGREGPVVHLGATLGSALAARFGLGRRLARTLLGCGVAAAVAASFNAPIAGVFFALEVVIGHYALSAFAPIVVASVVGTVISRMHYGDFPAFILPESFGITSFWEFPAFAMLGAVSALAAVLFMRSLIVSEDTFARLPVPAWARPALGGLAVGVIALAFPEVLGVGYEATDAAMREEYALWFLLSLIVAKTAATAISLGSGFAGGVFSPSLYVGAMVGGAFGAIAGSAFPDLASGQGAYTIVGMAAVAGAVLGAPVSTILMVFELTGDYTLTMALMVATVIASVLVQQLHGRSYFHWQLERRGISLREGQEKGLLRESKVRSLIDADYRAVDPEASLSEVRRAFAEAPYGELLVVDRDGALEGIITFSEIAEATFGDSRDDLLSAHSIARSRPEVLLADEDLETAIRRFSASGEPHLPVVDNDDNRRLLGMVHEHEVMRAYHRALLQARAEERGMPPDRHGSIDPGQSSNR